MQTDTTELYPALISYISIVAFPPEKGPKELYKLDTKRNPLTHTPQAHTLKCSSLFTCPWGEGGI